MDKKNLFEFYKNNIEKSWPDFLSIPDIESLKQSFEKFYKTRKEILVLMSNDWRSGNTKIQVVFKYAL
jgi:hypothetical protein